MNGNNRGFCIHSHIKIKCSQEKTFGNQNTMQNGGSIKYRSRSKVNNIKIFSEYYTFSVCIFIVIETLVVCHESDSPLCIMFLRR